MKEVLKTLQGTLEDLANVSACQKETLRCQNATTRAILELKEQIVRYNRQLVAINQKLAVTNERVESIGAAIRHGKPFESVDPQKEWRGSPARVPDPKPC